MSEKTSAMAKRVGAGHWRLHLEVLERAIGEVGDHEQREAEDDGTATTGMKYGCCTGVGDSSTIMATAPAPAGLGSPEKSWLSWVVVLKRARRMDVATRKRKATALPTRGTCHSPHWKARSAGCDTKGDDIREGVVGLAEGGGGAGHPGDPPIEDVGDDGEQDQQRRPFEVTLAGFEVAAARFDHREKAAEHVGHGEERWNQVDALAQSLPASADDG